MYTLFTLGKHKILLVAFSMSWHHYIQFEALFLFLLKSFKTLDSFDILDRLDNVLTNGFLMRGQ